VSDGQVLIPGMVTHSNVTVEHPQTVADGIEGWARTIGGENRIAGNDRGFASTAGNAEIPLQATTLGDSAWRWAESYSHCRGARGRKQNPRGTVPCLTILSEAPQELPQRRQLTDSGHATSGR
jgi:hypothetical protein